MRTILQLEPWRSLHEILLNRGVISEEMRRALEHYCQRWQVPQYQSILDCHILTEAELANHLADEFSFGRLLMVQQAQQDFTLQAGLTYRQAKTLCAIFARHRSSGKDYLILADPTAELSKHKVFQQEHLKSFEILIGEISTLLKLIEAWYPLEEQLQFEKAPQSEESSL